MLAANREPALDPGFAREYREHPERFRIVREPTEKPAKPAKPAPPAKQAQAPKLTLPPIAYIKSLLTPENLELRTDALRKARETIATERGIPASEVKITSLYRDNSTAHQRNAFDVSIKGAKSVHTEAKAVSEKLGADFTVIVEVPSSDGKTQENTYYHDGKGRTVKGNFGTPGFKATGTHLHIQTNKPK